MGRALIFLGIEAAPVIIGPRDGEDTINKDREYADELLLDVDQAGADVLVNDKPPDLGPLCPSDGCCGC